MRVLYSTIAAPRKISPRTTRVNEGGIKGMLGERDWTHGGYLRANLFIRF